MLAWVARTLHGSRSSSWRAATLRIRGLADESLSAGAVEADAAAAARANPVPPGRMPLKAATVSASLDRPAEVEIGVKHA